MSATAARTTHSRELLVLQLVVGLFVVLRLYFDLTADLFGDEAYYWMWGLRLGWSYFDHPPLHAWLLRAVSLLAGWHPLSVRLLTWLTLAGVLLIFRDWSRRLAPEQPALWFWRAAAIYLASPMFFGMTMIAYNDHLLVFCSLLALHIFLVFAERQETGAPRALRWLYLAAFALGLAVLTKYNGVFIGLGMAATLLLRPKLRAVLRTPHPWLAALLSMLMQAPVIYWNLTEGLASFRYHLDDRWNGGAGQLHLMHPLVFLLLSVVLWSPFLLWPLLRFIRTAPASDFEARAKTLALATFAISTLSFLAISVVLDAYFYWNIVAFVALTPLLTRFINRWLLATHIVFGIVVAGLIVTNFAVTPLAPLMGIRSDHGSPSNYGWAEIAGYIRAAEATSPTDLVAATRYSTTSQLGFALGITDAVKLSPEHSQYDYWQAGLPPAGKSALILTDEADKSAAIAYLQDHFDTLTEVDSFEITRLGRPVYAWRIFRGDGLRP